LEKATSRLTLFFCKAADGPTTLELESLFKGVAGHDLLHHEVVVVTKEDPLEGCINNNNNTPKISSEDQEMEKKRRKKENRSRHLASQSCCE